MTDIERQMFRHYIYGRVNEYYMFKEYRMAPGESYKDFKISLTFSRLGISEKHKVLFINLIRLSTHFETAISFLVVFFRFIKSSFLLIINKQQIIENQNLILSIPCRQINTLFKKARIDTNNIIVVNSPYGKSSLFDKNWGGKVSLFSNLGFKEVVSSFLLSCKMAFFLKRKYGHRDCMFRAYSAFDYFLSYYYFTKSSNSNTVYFVSTNDRWTYLFGHLNCRTVFLQHGALNKDKVLFIMSSIGKASEGYYFNQTQRDICNRYMFSNIPEAKFFSQMEYTANEKLLNNGKMHVLLVCELIYFEKERTIIKDVFSTQKYNLYVKPHPQNNPIRYRQLQEIYGFVILGKTDYPAVDYVISYDSTLVLEYQSKGVKTLMYEDVDYQVEYQKLLST